MTTDTTAQGRPMTMALLIDFLTENIDQINAALPGRDEVTAATLAEHARTLGQLQAAAGRLADVIASLAPAVAAATGAGQSARNHTTTLPDGTVVRIERDPTHVWDDSATVKALLSDHLDADEQLPEDVGEAVHRILSALPKNHGWLVDPVARYAKNTSDLRASTLGRARVRVILGGAA